GLSVQVDLSSLGGASNQTFFDDGTHGDVTPGNLTFSFAMTIPITQNGGQYSLPFTINDAQGRTNSGALIFTILPYAWNETREGGGDAGETLGTAMAVTGSGPLTAIRGALGTVIDVDLYKINICDPQSFFA